VAGLISGFGRGKGYFVGEQGGIDAPLILSLENPRFLCPLPTLIHDALEILKTPLNVVVAEERALDGPEDLTTETAAHIGLYTHRAQADRGSSSRPGGLNS
jgi:hypothetical protein